MRIWVILDAGKGIYLFLYCLLLVALIRCFANHVQRAQLQHHLSQSEATFASHHYNGKTIYVLQAVYWKQNKIFKLHFPYPLKAISFHQSKWQNWKVSSVQACRITLTTTRLKGTQGCSTKITLVMKRGIKKNPSPALLYQCLKSSSWMMKLQKRRGIFVCCEGDFESLSHLKS